MGIVLARISDQRVPPLRRSSAAPGKTIRSVGIAILLSTAFAALAVALPSAAAEESDAESTAGGPQPPITGPRELLRRYGFDDESFAKLLDGRPLDESETEVFMKAMYWLRRFPKTNLQNWTREELPVAEMFEDARNLRGQLFPLSGRVVRVDVRQPDSKLAEGLELKRFYRCGFQTGDGQPAVIYTENVPKQWRQGGAIDARAGARGLLLKFAGKAGRPTPVFLAQRVAFYPETPLGDLRMDVGLLDDVQNRRWLTKHDREAFYKMLAAAGRAKPGQLLRQADGKLEAAGQEKFSVVPMFLESEQQIGQLFALRGTTRHVVKIRVEDPDIVKRFGIDHYYEIAMVTEDSQNNPIWFCVRELPPGMPTGDDPGYAERVRVAGFFFKLWVYRSQRPAGDKPQGQLQPAPLLIGRQPVWYKEEPPAGHPLAAAIAGAMFLLALLGIWIAVWRSGRSDKEFEEKTLRRAIAPDSGISLNEIGLDADGKPDFSGLEEMERKAAEESDR